MPLVSRGGTSTVISCIYFGIILSVSRFGANMGNEEEGIGNGDSREDMSSGSATTYYYTVLFLHSLDFVSVTTSSVSGCVSGTQLEISSSVMAGTAPAPSVSSSSGSSSSSLPILAPKRLTLRIIPK